MIYLSAEGGQSLQLYHPDEVRPPERGPFVPDLLRQIISRYRFAKPPASLPSDNEGPLKFEMGALTSDALEIPIHSLEIYRDGIIVNTRNTDDSDLVLDDFLEWMISDFGFREPSHAVPRRHTSTVVVELDKSIDSFLARFERIQQIFADLWEREKGERRSMHVSQFTLSPNIGEPQRDFFRIEIRRGNPDVIENRYFCTAPFTTRSHLELLTALEAI